jgi:ABC-type branched-subunit amino acid transport system substrate-binding protein
MLRYTFLAVLFALALPCSAQIKIGQTAGFTGTVASTVKEVTDGARLYLDWTNARGGVNGQTIELVSLDDGFDAKRTVENARKLIADPNIVALFLSRGTSHSEALMPVLSEGKIVLIAPSTGAMSLHRPVHPWIFNVRAPYQREAERAIRHLSLIGMERIAVIQADDSFGADVATGANKGFVAVDKKPVLLEKFDRAKPNFDQIAPKVVKAEAQGVLFIGSGDEVANGAAALRAAGSRAQIVTLSNNASTGFVKSLKENARGTIVSQVFPYERSMSAAIVKEASDIAQAKNIADVTPAMLEGFAGAKVLVEALRRAGPSPSRQKIQQALESFRRVDIGGLEVSFSPTDHTGLDYADLSIIGPDGKFRR